MVFNTISGALALLGLKLEFDLVPTDHRQAYHDFHARSIVLEHTPSSHRPPTTILLDRGLDLFSNKNPRGRGTAKSSYIGVFE